MIFDFQDIGKELYSMTMPDVDLQDELLPQSESAYPDNRFVFPWLRQYVILKLGLPSKYSMR